MFYFYVLPSTRLKSFRRSMETTQIIRRQTYFVYTVDFAATISFQCTLIDGRYKIFVICLIVETTRAFVIIKNKITYVQKKKNGTFYRKIFKIKIEFMKNFIKYNRPESTFQYSNYIRLVCSERNDS